MNRQIATPARLLLVVGILFLLCLPQAKADPAATGNTASGPDFQSWLAGFRKEAAAAGISRATLDATLNGLQPDEKVLKHDQNQPEFLQTFWHYLDVRVTDKRIAIGREKLRSEAALLATSEKRYGIPARYLVALWGLETNYGTRMGKLAIIPSLATLAYDDRRSHFFRSELLDALRIVDRGDIPAKELLGSWAGAFGNMQFMPSTFLHYGVDGDGDGRINTRTSVADAIDSAANYLKQSGWRKGQGWGWEVRLPKKFEWKLARPAYRRPVSQWAAMGVTLADGKPLPASSLNAAILLPQGYTGPAIMVLHNFGVLMHWNHSVNYALAVGQLADRLAGKPAFRTGRDADNRPLSRQQAIDLQETLAELGYDPGPIDGLPGRKTLNAIRAYQVSADLPADGYPSLNLLKRLHDALAKSAVHGSSSTASGSAATAAGTS